MMKERKKQLIHVRLTDPDKVKLTMYCKEAKKTYSQAIREAIKNNIFVVNDER